jgi:hypothetical protein
MVKTRGMNLSKSTSKEKGEKKIRKITRIADIFLTSFLSKVKN